MELPRGMRDLEPAELHKIHIIREKFEETASIFGFEMVDPSPIESLSTLEAKSGPEIRKEIYNFRDKADREIALRFDFTVGMTRYVASKQFARMPAKFGSFGGVWRYNEPQKGRYRYFHQWNVEIFGTPSVESESEVIEFASILFEKLGIGDSLICINHRELVESFIKKTYPGFENDRDWTIIGDSFRMIDKAAKKPRKDLLAEYSKLPEQYAEALLDFAAAHGTPDKIESSVNVKDLEKWDHIKNLWDSLENRTVANKEINLGVVRGLDYYSGTVFEIFDSAGHDALAGGGRYDRLTKAFGRKDMGATGMAGGVERMIMAMDAHGTDWKNNTRYVSVTYMNPDLEKAAMHAASQIRRAGIRADVDLAGRAFKKQLKACSDSTYAVIIAPAEFEKGQIIIKDMHTGNQNTVPKDDFVNNLKNLMQKPE